MYLDNRILKKVVTPQYTFILQSDSKSVNADIELISQSVRVHLNICRFVQIWRLFVKHLWNLVRGTYTLGLVEPPSPSFTSVCFFVNLAKTPPAAAMHVNTVITTKMEIFLNCVVFLFNTSLYGWLGVWPEAFSGKKCCVLLIFH